MGAAESKAEKEGTNNNQDRNDREGGTGSNKNGSSSSDISTGTALAAVGAAVGTAALLGVAWGVSKYRSKDSDERDEDHYFHTDSFNTMPGVAKSIKNVGDLLEGFKPKPVDSYSNYNYSHSHERKCTLKILSYNVCSREDYAIHERMEAIGDLVQRHSPHFICFQEITPAIYTIFQGSSWWNDYYCSMSPEEASKKTEEPSNKQQFCIVLVNSGLNFNSMNRIPTEHIGMGKELCAIETNIGTNISLVVATSHLKSHNSNPNDPKSQYHQFKKQRSDQAKQALAILEDYPNVIFGGDMNWDEKMDGKFPLPEGWVDAWTKLRGEEVGYTFDTKSNEMLNGRPPFQTRLDRILCNLKDFKLEKIEIIGNEAIPDVSYEWNNKKLPVLPSDHYGLLLTVCT